MKQYDAIIIGFGKGGKTLAAELAKRNEKVAEVPASILDAFLQKHWFIRQSWLR